MALSVTIYITVKGANNIVNNNLDDKVIGKFTETILNMIISKHLPCKVFF